MKIVAAGLLSALLIFAVATVMTEVLSNAEEAAVGVRSTQRVASSSSATKRTTKTARGTSKSQPDPVAEQEESTRQIEQMLRDVRVRESAVLAKEEAIRLISADIQEEQQLTELMRQRLTSEIALLNESRGQAARRETERPTRITQRFPTKPTSGAAVVSLRNSQAVHDMAVLVKRLATDNGQSAATTMLQRLKERDAAKVLAELSGTDSPLALQLSQNLLLARSDESDRR